MRLALVALLLWGSAAAAIGSGGRGEGSDAAEATAVLGELSQRSGIEAPELSRLLSDCDASQQSMYFCAWRDQIAADRLLKRSIGKSGQRLPGCRPKIEARVGSWARARDRSCDRSANKDWGEGSMAPTARAICLAKATTRMAKRVEGMRSCELR